MIEDVSQKRGVNDFSHKDIKIGRRVKWVENP